MKIIKKEEVKVVTEDIQVEAGTYYFEDDNWFYRVCFTEDEDEWIDYKCEKFQQYSNVRKIIVYKDYEQQLPWDFKQLWTSGVKTIEEKEYMGHRQQLIEELCKI